MPSSRQPDPTRGLFDGDYLARALSVTYPDGHVLPSHHHPWPQLVYAAAGVMQVHTDAMAWLVPTTRAIWVPAGVPHSIRMRGSVAMRTLYLAPEGYQWPTECRAIEVSELLRALVLHLVTLASLLPTRPEHRRLLGVFADLIATGETVPLTLRLPRDPRAVSLARRILDEPGTTDGLATLAEDCGASQRTLQRLFQAETSLSLESWRLRARMQQGVVALSEGASVTEATFAAGYRSASAFIAAFKRTFGVTPSRYRVSGPEPSADAPADAAPRPDPA